MLFLDVRIKNLKKNMQNLKVKLTADIFRNMPSCWELDEIKRHFHDIMFFVYFKHSLLYIFLILLLGDESIFHKETKKSYSK